MSDDLVSTEWLAQHLSSPDIAILDCSWHLPQARRDPAKEFRDGHIPGAQFFDLDEISEADTKLPHMLPKPEKFSSRMRKLGIGDGKRVICYDATGLFAAARAWWMFKVFGHNDVAVLDGGLPKWKAENRPLDDGPALAPQPRHFTARYNSVWVRDKREVASALKDHSEQVVDARGAARFTGAEAEPRPGVRAGHMPGARNLHYATLLNADGTMKSRGDIEKMFKALAIDPRKPVITTCGSGVTAAILSLALEVTGHHHHALYDGSWAEWGADPDAAVAVGPA